VALASITCSGSVHAIPDVDAIFTHYLVLFKNPRDTSQIAHLGRQMFPERVKYFREAFADATSQPYGYLLVDLKTTTPHVLRLRTDIFPDERTMVYVYK
jgi:hypothetical protein